MIYCFKGEGDAMWIDWESKDDISPKQQNIMAEKIHW